MIYSVNHPSETNSHFGWRGGRGGGGAFTAVLVRHIYVHLSKRSFDLFQDRYLMHVCIWRAALNSTSLSLGDDISGSIAVKQRA